MLQVLGRIVQQGSRACAVTVSQYIASIYCAFIARLLEKTDDHIRMEARTTDQAINFSSLYSPDTSGQITVKVLVTSGFLLFGQFPIIDKS